MIVLLSLAALCQGVQGHGAVTKPLPRKLAGAAWCPWCVGEHNSGNPYGKVHLSAKPGSACLGTKRGDPNYVKMNFGGYQASVGEGPSAYVAGQPLDTTIVLDADHAGLAQWSYCPHSEAETDECFKKNALTEWTDVHSYWGGDSTIDHWKDGGIYPQTVLLPNIAPQRVTLRWLWVCKYTDELFASCIDVDIVASDGAVPSPSPTKAPTPAPVDEEPEPEPEPEPTLAPSPTPVGDECAGVWDQCGGKTWSGATCCASDLKCHTQNEWYSQCIPASASMAEIKPRKYVGAFLK